MTAHKPFKISVLIYLRDSEGRLLLMRRKQAPNLGLWSSIGGKLEMERGESPFECAIREAREEIGVTLTESDLHLFGIITEKNYESNGHWMMFLFDCRVVLENLPPDIDEGDFAFHEPSAVEQLPIPETDRKALWPIYFKNRKGFTSLRTDCHPDKDLHIIIEEQF